MATRRYMTNRGEQDTSVTEAVGAATATKNLEVTADLAVFTGGGGKDEVLKGLMRIYRYILKQKWPPA